jgi:tungstate transport system substrate-binding protein
MGERRIRTSTPLAAAILLAAVVSAPLTVCGPRPETIQLGSTTSTYDSGLLDDLVPAFAEAYPQYSLKVIAVGTGEALELGRRKDVDVLLVHAPAAEIEFVRNGYGFDRRPVMYNDFVIVGPPDDPAGVGMAITGPDALRRIAAAGAEFLSRGDDSGTHKRERFLWSLSGLEPVGDWYREAGQGMAASLLVADASSAYTLTDRATFQSLAGRLGIVPLFEGDPLMLNLYSVIQVSDARQPGGASDFADWLTSDAGRARIAAFRPEGQGAPLFRPVTESDPPPSARRELERALSSHVGGP